MSDIDDTLNEIVQALNGAMLIKGGGNLTFDNGERIVITAEGDDAQFFREIVGALQAKDMEGAAFHKPAIILPRSPQFPGDSGEQLTLTDRALRDGRNG